MDTHTLLSASIENAILSCCSSALHTREHAPYPHSVRVTLMELIWETSAALPGRGIYWQGESQTQSITLPVCPIISHQERWLAKINWLFHEKQSIWKDDVLSAVRSHLPALWNRIMAGKWSSSQGPRGDVHMCVGLRRATRYVSWWRLLLPPLRPLYVYLLVSLIWGSSCPVSQSHLFWPAVVTVSLICINWSPDFAHLAPHLVSH